MIIDKYIEIITDRYVEPKEEEILSSFLSLPPMPPVTQKQPSPQKRLPAAKPNIKKKAEKQSRDIRQLFQMMAEKNSNTEDEIDDHRNERDSCY